MVKFEKFMEIVDSVYRFIKYASKYYPHIFKASIAMFGLFLITLSQGYPHIIEQQYEAKKLQYSLESKTGKTLDDITCEITNDEYELCMLAKYKQNDLENIGGLLIGITLISIYSGMGLFILSIGGFLLNYVNAENV